MRNIQTELIFKKLTNLIKNRITPSLTTEILTHFAVLRIYARGIGSTLYSATATAYFSLQQLQKHGALSAVHLDMMKLEGDGEHGLEQSFAILAPHHHRIAELICVLVHNAIKFGMHHC